MRVNLIWIKIIWTLHNLIVWSLLFMIYSWYFFVFWKNIYFLVFGIILLIFNVYILKKNILTLRGYQAVSSILDEYLFLFISNLSVLKIFIQNIMIKFTNKKIKPFKVWNVMHTIRLKW